MNNEDTKIFHNGESLKAVFGDITAFEGSVNDVYALAEKCAAGSFYITGAVQSPYAGERKRLAETLGDRAQYVETAGEVMDLTEPAVLKDAVDWLCR